MMSVARLAVRSALRQANAPRALSAVSASGASWTTGFACSYHSYGLPSTPPSAPRNDNVPESSIAQPETRPPQGPATPTAPKVNEAEAQQPDHKATKPAPRQRPKLRARKAAMKLTPAAVEQLRTMLDQPEPKLIKVGVRNRGCSGLAYHLEYVDKPGSFDEAVEQDGVKVLIDSKALFSIIGSEMDWAEDKLNQRFVFKNPNISMLLPALWPNRGDLLTNNQRNSAAAANRLWFDHRTGLPGKTSTHPPGTTGLIYRCGRHKFKFCAIASKPVLVSTKSGHTSSHTL